MWKGISIVSGISIILSFLINIYFYKNYIILVQQESHVVIKIN